jgi:hypothetical protein
MSATDVFGLLLICTGFAVVISWAVVLSDRFGTWIGEKYDRYYSFGRLKK